ncbi:MAG: hypothetical protein ABI742_00680 [Gemmatimonadota bacterium]
MNLLLTRESVCAGDDGDAPHPRTLRVPDEASLDVCLATVIPSGYLPSISGGLATWSVASGRPLAVLAQQWTAPRMIFLMEREIEGRDRTPGALHLHFN